MKLAQNFFRLPLRFDVEQLKKEVDYFEQQAWMPHPNGLVGNSAMPLISKDGGDNDHFHGSMKVTPHLRQCDYIQQAIASFGEVFGRSRLMKLGPGCEVSKHTDTNHHWHSRVRIHIPITTNPDVLFYCGQSVVNMQAGECWIFDAWQQHRVVNSSDQTRVHLVIDTSGSAKFWRMVAESEVPGVKNGPADHFVEFKKGMKSTIETEQHNVTPVMNPGELDGLIDGLVNDFVACASNNEQEVKAYTQILFDFSKDWRSLYYRYGDERRGINEYAGLLDQTAAILKQQTGDLLTASNSIPVNDVIFFKIFSAAIHVDLLKDSVGDRPEPKPKPAPPKLSAKISRNAQCPCGSGKKYKHCHGAV
jgi:hypothetical protein